MPFSIIRNDITKMSTDAIVNAANNHLLAGGGVCGAIFHAAGAERLQRACQKIGFVATGGAVITKGYQLPSRFIIHTAGPHWQGGKFGEEEALYSCYQSSLKLAKKHNLKSIAFPLVSAGIYGYPRVEAIAVAVRAIGDFLEKNEMEITLVIYDQETFEIGGALYQEIKEYIDNHYAKEHEISRSVYPMRIQSGLEESYFLEEAEKFPSEEQKNFSDTITFPPKSGQAFELSEPQKIKRSSAKTLKTDQKNQIDSFYASTQNLGNDLERRIYHLDLSFSQSLLRLIDEKGMTDVETYKKANIDRKLFSKIRKDINYTPKKSTAIAFAIALELSLSETNDLLMKAGYILSHSNKFDVIIEYFIKNGNYNIMEINEALFAFDQSLLGA